VVLGYMMIQIHKKPYIRAIDSISILFRFFLDFFLILKIHFRQCKPFCTTLHHSDGSARGNLHVFSLQQSFNGTGTSFQSLFRCAGMFIY
jgi:hypothetical protein